MIQCLLHDDLGATYDVDSLAESTEAIEIACAYESAVDGVDLARTADVGNSISDAVLSAIEREGYCASSAFFEDDVCTMGIHRVGDELLGREELVEFELASVYAKGLHERTARDDVAKTQFLLNIGTSEE